MHSMPYRFAGRGTIPSRIASSLADFSGDGKAPPQPRCHLSHRVVTCVLYANAVRRSRRNG